MNKKTAFLYSDAYLTYNLRDDHPLQQKRLKMVYRLLEAYGVLDTKGGPIEWIEPTPCTEEALLEVHTPDFVEAVQRAGGDQPQSTAYLRRYGIGPGDTPAFPGMFDAARLYCGGTVDAARLVLNGYDSAFNVAGGLHHAHPDHAAGFCTFNDCALGIHELLRGGCERVAYIDIDAHHGDGVQACFYDDPRVLTVSLHESGKSLYPGTGFPNEIGAPGAEGASVNLPYYRYTSDDVWHEAFDAVIPDVLSRFNADAYLFQFGADAHYGDPLAHLMLTSRGWMQAVEKLFRLAAGKPIIITGGGGYNIRTVARLWTMVMAHAAEVNLPEEVPAAYAQEYGIPNLHDTERMPPVADDLRVEGRNYARARVKELREYLEL